MKKISIYTDGACSGNPGPGGYGAILMYNGREKEVSGYVPDTTNNRMELFAVVVALSMLKEPCEIDLYSDSAYLVSAFKEGWIENWQKNGWKSGKNDVKNQDLWRDLIIKSSPHKINWIKVKGHSDNEYNNRCDKLAVQAIKSRETI